MINIIRLAIVNFFIILAIVIAVDKLYFPKNSAQNKFSILGENITISSTIPNPQLNPAITITPKPTFVVVNKQPSAKTSPVVSSIPITPPLTNNIQTAQSNPPQPTNTPIPPTQPQVTTPSNLTSQVPSHTSQSDCWVIYSGGVYNITGYFGHHPGKDLVLAQACGKDITAVFNAVPHSSKAKQVLETFRIQ